MENKKIQLTIRIDAGKHKVVKKHLVDIEKSFNEYVNDLIDKDLHLKDKTEEIK